MDSLPSKIILSKKPKQYFKQGLSHCGVYSVKAILSAFGLDNKKHPKEYQTNWVGRHLFSMTIGRDYYVKIFSSYGLNAKAGNAEKLSGAERLDLLKRFLANESPIMIRIGNGYIFSNKYTPVLGKIIPHWITLWGYDEDKQIFYIYDSGLPKKCWKNDLLIGNTIRTYKEILRDWNFGNWQVFAWNYSREKCAYVVVSL